MRILLANKYWRQLGGVESHVFAVRDWLEKLGHEVIPFAMADDHSEPAATASLFPSNVDFRVSGPRPAVKALERSTTARSTIRNLRLLIDKYSPDAAYVVHIYHQLGMRMLNELERNQIPTVLSLHDYKIACPNYRFFSERTGAICTKCLDHSSGYLWAPFLEGCWANSRLAGLALSTEAVAVKKMRSYRKPGAVLVLNKLQHEAARNAGVDSRKILTVPHPVALAAGRPRGKREHVLFVGRLVPEKGLDVLIRSAAETRIGVLVVGDGRSGDELRQLSRSLDAPVEFLGIKSPADVISLMRNCAALVVPSVWHEVSPLVVYEAIANDVPVVGTIVGGIVDQLEGGRGILVSPNDVHGLSAALTRLVTTPDVGREISETARQFARSNWSPDQWSKLMASAFELAGSHSVLEEPSNRNPKSSYSGDGQ